MQYTTQTIEASRGRVCEQAARIAQQRQKIVQALAEHLPADALQARLLLMEQSLTAMMRLLRIQERDLQDEASIQQYRTGKRIKDRRKTVRSEGIAEAADRFAAQATDSVLAPDENVESLDSLAKAMRQLAGH